MDPALASRVFLTRGRAPAEARCAPMLCAGKGAVVHRFTDGNLNLIGNHMMDTMYLKHRVPFEQARAGQF